MKKLLFLLLIGFSIFLIKIKPDQTIFVNNNLVTPKLSTPSHINPQKTKYNIQHTSLFMPYWTLPETIDTVTMPAIEPLSNRVIDNYIYFGVAPNESGINTSEPGYNNLKKFTQLDIPANSQKTLTLRMINTDINLAILDNQTLQDKTISETITLAKQHNFTGVLYDLELKALPTESITDKVTGFITRSAGKIKSSGLGFSMTIYGDTFFRKRPYDLAALSPLVDQFVVMAYDFHKSGGTPGPNFPLIGVSQYGYDFNKMLDDFLNITSPDKMTIVFGMFGYDWTVDSEGRPVKPAKALTIAQIKKEFFPVCRKTNCRVARDNSTSESNITYTDLENKNHVIWFEDELSIEKKMDALKKMDIPSVSFWAFGYF